MDCVDVHDKPAAPGMPKSSGRHPASWRGRAASLEKTIADKVLVRGSYHAALHCRRDIGIIPAVPGAIEGNEGDEQAQGLPESLPGYCVRNISMFETAPHQVKNHGQG